MPRARTATRREFKRADCTPVPITRWLNFPGPARRGAFWKQFASELRHWPAGAQKPWGIPFRMASGKSRPRLVTLLAGESVVIPVGAKADYVCVLHTFRKMDADMTVYGEADAVGEYELVYDRGETHRQPIRARLDVPIPESPGPAQMAVSFSMPTAVDPVAPPPGGVHWGRQQCGETGGWGEPLVYAIRNPNPGRRVKALVVYGLAPSPVIVAGVTAYRGADHPLRHLARRMYRLRAKSRKGNIQPESVEVDLGAVARKDRTLGTRGKAWVKSPYAGVTNAEEPEKDGVDVYSIYGARDATVSAKLPGRGKPVDLSLGEAYETGSSTRGGITLERLGGQKQWVEVEIVDGSTGQPTPVRLHMSGAAGEYLAPYGHHEQVNANWFEDYGADLRVGNRSYAYVPGRFTTDLPAGDLYVELFKGFEYKPTRVKVALKPGQKKLRLRIDRWKDLRAKGWVTADTHVHFLSPRTAWLEAQCEGVNVVNLLASQWGRLFTNVGDISGRVGVAEDDTIVWVGTENRNHMLGHISMLGTKGLPVYPMCGGGITESWVGDPDFRALTEWAQECKQKDGLVIRPHFPYCGFTEDPVLAVMGVVDALEVRVGPGDAFPLQEWYRYLNNGYRVAVAGGTDKMGAYSALGCLRTYALLDPNRRFTFARWADAVRAGRTYATTGPLMDLRVDGHPIGDTIRLPRDGAVLPVTATAESAWPLGRIEIVRNGRVVASESSRGRARSLKVTARVRVDGSGWIAARCSGPGNTPAGSMAAHTSPVYLTCGRQRPYDGPALEHMLNLTRGGIEYLETLSTRFSEADQQRILKIYRNVEKHLHDRLHAMQGLPPHKH